MAWALTNVTKGFDLTPWVPATSVTGFQSAYGDTSRLAFTVDDETGTIVIDAEDEIQFTDTGVKSFAGIARRITKTDNGFSIQRVYGVECQDFNTLLDDDVVDVGGLRQTVESDKARITWLFATYGTRGVVIGTAVVQLAATIAGDQDFTGMTLHQALSAIASITGGSFYVDYDKVLHYYTSETNPAPFGLSDNPNFSTTFEYESFALPIDSVAMYNAVFVIGDQVSGWRYKGGSPPAAGTRRAYVLRDQDITTTAELNARGDRFLDSAGDPRQPGTLSLYRPGLRAGMYVPVTHAGWGITAVNFRIQNITFQPQSKDRTRYDLTFGSSPIGLAAIVGGAATTAQAGYAVAQTIAVGDLIPPAQVTGFTLVSSFRQATDGTQWPNLTANWSPSAAGDLDAYELEVDRALTGFVGFTASVSGTGGTLTAGDYRIYVTGLGTVFGETARADVPIIATITAGQRIFVNITAKSGVASYKVYAERADDPRYSIATAVTGSNVEVTREGTTGDATAPTVSTAAAFLNPSAYRTANTSYVIDAVQGGIVYIGRVRAVDDSGNRGIFSNPASVQAAGDATAPEMVAGLSATAGKSVVGLTWQRNSEPDLDRYGVRWAPDLAGAPDTTQWAYATTRSTIIVITDLNPGITYWFEARAIDTSNNVRTSTADATPVNSDTNVQAGWSDPVASTPGLVTGNDIALGTLVAAHISAAGLDASIIKTGTLSVGGTPNTPDFLLVYNSLGQEIGRWDANGLLIKDPGNSARQMRFINGTLSFSSNGGSTWTTAANADGITADAIKLGSAPGGHNAIPNSSFELSAFATTLTKLWTSAADWATSIAASDVNVNKTTTELRMTTFTY